MSRGRQSRATVYARLEAAIAELNERLGGLPSPKESEYVWSDIWHLEAHHSTASKATRSFCARLRHSWSKVAR